MTRLEKNKLRLEERVSKRRKEKKWIIFILRRLEDILRLIELAHHIGLF